MSADSAPSTALETIGLEEAALLLRLSPSALRKRAAAGRVPGAKIGRQWVFVRADLIELIREQAKARTPRAIAIRPTATVPRSALLDDLRALRTSMEAKRKQSRG